MRCCNGSGDFGPPDGKCGGCWACSKPAPSAEPEVGTIVGTGWVSRDGANAYGYKTRHREVDVELDSDGDLLIDIEERWGGTGDKCCCTIKASILRALLSRAGLAIVKASDVPRAEERAVLEAWKALDRDDLRILQTMWTGTISMCAIGEIARRDAELARRAAKEKP